MSIKLLPLFLIVCSSVFTQGLSAQDTLTQEKEFRLEITKGEGVLLYLRVTNTGSEKFEIPTMSTEDSFVTITRPDGRQIERKFILCRSGTSINTNVLAAGESHTYELDLEMMLFGFRPRKAEDVAMYGFKWTFYDQTTGGIGVRL